jgi:PiT family inorganic phosphate transporter
MILLVALLSFYVAWNLGANDVANAMGTSVGSKAVTLQQALLIAGVLEFTGAVLFGHEVSETLATEIVNPAFFAATPQLLLFGMVSVLLACGLWLQVATARGWPVSSSHAVVGAIAGFSASTVGFQAIDWSSMIRITIAWVITPVFSGIISACFYSVVKRWILEQQEPLRQLSEWIPWLSALLMGVFGAIALPVVSQPIHAFLTQRLDWHFPAHDLPLILGTMATFGITLSGWQQLEERRHFRAEEAEEAEGAEGEKSKIQNPYAYHSPVERIMARYQLLSACFVAFAHGSNDVGNAIAPLAAIAYINRTGSVPLNGMNIPLWILVLGGVGIVAGLAVWGKKVIATIGEGIIPLQPSSGFCAELATAATILLASRLGLPVSTSHALVGGVVGIGLVQNRNSIQFKTLQGIAGAWIITVPVSAILGASIFAMVRLFFL